MESLVLTEIFIALADTYPWFSDILLWFGILWLLFVTLLNLIDLLAGIFKWNISCNFLKTVRLICEKLGPSLSIFSAWAQKRIKNKTYK